MNGLVAEARYWGVVPAAGLGERMGGDTPKQYLELAGSTVIAHALERLLSLDVLQGLVVALHKKDQWWPQQTVAGHSRVETVVGGEQRCHSVLAALESLQSRAQPRDWVLVHDAARPCIRREDVEHLIRELTQDEVGGLLAVPVVETVKRADADGRVERTLDREHLWLAQTPQLFRYGLLYDCLRAALARGEPVTDEASAIELAGLQPRLISGSRSNIKLTLPADLATAEAWLARGE